MEVVKVSEKQFEAEVAKKVKNYKKHLAVLYYHSGYSVEFAVKLLKQFGAVDK